MGPWKPRNCENELPVAMDCSISLKFGTEFDHMTADI